MRICARSSGVAQDEIEAMSGSSTAISNEELEGIKPLAVTVKIACGLLGVGNTTMWGLIKAGRVKTVSIGRRRLVIYASLEALISEGGAAS
jgi:excisionase family DNA binding protein